MFFNPISFYGNYYEKQEGPVTSHQYLFRLTNTFKSFLY